VLAQAWGDGAHWTSDNDVHPHETQVLRLNSTKAESRLGWCSRLSVEETLESVAQWHRASAAGEDMRRITESQIDRYCSRVHA
jgi:CDP-glucose 4,6-dehydratase